MEPRFFKRGNDRKNPQPWRPWRGFNGTTFFQTWKSVRPPKEFRRTTPASMEPRFFKRGNERNKRQHR